MSHALLFSLYLNILHPYLCYPIIFLFYIYIFLFPHPTLFYSIPSHPWFPVCYSFLFKPPHPSLSCPPFYFLVFRPLLSCALSTLILSYPILACYPILALPMPSCFYHFTLSCLAKTNLFQPRSPSSVSPTPFCANLVPHSVEFLAIRTRFTQHRTGALEFSLLSL